VGYTAVTRIAWLSPLPPESSGIADYSVELLEGLRHRFEIDLYCGAPASLPEAVAGMSARGYADFVGQDTARPYAAVLYQVGNNPQYHREIYRLLLRRPGIVVLHEYMLHDLLRWFGKGDDFVAAMRYSYGISGEQTGREMLDGLWPSERWVYPLFEPVVDASQHIIVHGETARARVLASCPSATVTVVPLPLSLGGLPAVDAGSRLALRRDLGVPADALLLASFGYVTPIKRIEVGLRAFARLRRRYPEARYVLTGEIPPYYQELLDILKGPLGEGVIVTGRLSFPRMLELMEATDIAFNLRSPTGGETSAICVRVLGLGTPVVVSEGDWFSEIPDGCCALVSSGTLEEEELVAVLESLAADPTLRREMGAAAARWAGHHHSIKRVVDDYAAVFDTAVRGGRRPGPVSLVEPPPPDGRATTDLMLDLADAAARVGVRDDDAVLLPSLVETMAALGLTGR
jgi:glycosyltransferase involved in cell wall biosynthesis